MATVVITETPTLQAPSVKMPSASIMNVTKILTIPAFMGGILVISNSDREIQS